eukprot:8263997-Alexandrium_andersonii.AAC.1
MSASLVGSEMCIRDRHTLGAAAVRPVRVPGVCAARHQQLRPLREGVVDEPPRRLLLSLDEELVRPRQ